MVDPSSSLTEQKVVLLHGAMPHITQLRVHPIQGAVGVNPLIHDAGKGGAQQAGLLVHLRSPYTFTPSHQIKSNEPILVASSARMPFLTMASA